jgi:hypothetical protein
MPAHLESTISKTSTPAGERDMTQILIGLMLAIAGLLVAALVATIRRLKQLG